MFEMPSSSFPSPPPVFVTRRHRRRLHSAAPRSTCRTGASSFAGPAWPPLSTRPWSTGEDCRQLSSRGFETCRHAVSDRAHFLNPALPCSARSGVPGRRFRQLECHTQTMHCKIFGGPKRLATPAALAMQLRHNASTQWSSLNASCSAPPEQRSVPSCCSTHHVSVVDLVNAGNVNFMSRWQNHTLRLSGLELLVSLLLVWRCSEEVSPQRSHPEKPETELLLMLLLHPALQRGGDGAGGRGGDGL